MLVDKVQKMLADSIAERNEPKKSILKVLVSEIQRLHGEVKDVQVVSIAKKMVESNMAMMSLQTDEAKKNVLVAENQVLEEFLPKMASKEDIMREVHLLKDDFVVKPDSQCYGLGFAKLKKLGINADGNLVKKCIDEVRQ